MFLKTASFRLVKMAEAISISIMVPRLIEHNLTNNMHPNDLITATQNKSIASHSTIGQTLYHGTTHPPFFLANERYKDVISVAVARLCFSLMTNPLLQFIFAN
jgi:hypothetical protein